MLQRDISFGMLCAFANNNVRCYDMSLDFVEHVQENIAEEYQDELEVEEVYRALIYMSIQETYANLRHVNGFIINTFHFVVCVAFGYFG